MVLAVVNVHGFSVDPRGECILGKPQVGKLERLWTKRGPARARRGVRGFAGGAPQPGAQHKSCARGAGEFQKRSLVHDTKMVWDCVGEEALHRFM